MKYEYGFIGVGNMGGALAQGIAKKIGGDKLILNNRTIEKAKILADSIGATVGSLEEVVTQSKYIMLGVKPQGLKDLLDTIKPYINKDSIFITMAAGKEMAFISNILGHDIKIIRIMPNMPAKIGEGMTLATVNDNVSNEEYKSFEEAMQYCGEIDKMDELLIDPSMAVSGCGPAYVYMMIEALRDGAIKLGIDADKALKYAIQTMYGSVKLLKDSGSDVSKLRQSICSPGGTTIEGVKVLNNGGFDKLVSDCLEAAYKRSEELK